MDGVEGKVLNDAKDEKYLVLNELKYKNIACVYAKKVSDNTAEEIKKFFQLTGDEKIPLVEITSKKLLNALNDCLYEATTAETKPRKIGENESISDYLAYLDEFYKTKIVPSL